MADLKSQRIYQSLRERILRNELEPGARMVLRDLAVRYETSDIPIREALRMLERDGLVEWVPYRGARVTALSSREIEETYFIRGHLESIATGLAAQRLTAADLAQLDELMVAMRQARDDADGARFSQLNRTFHESIMARCGNQMLCDLAIEIWQRHSGFQRVFRQVPDRLATSQAEHEEIMAALRARDSELAAKLALAHKQSVSGTVSSLLEAERGEAAEAVADGVTEPLAGTTDGRPA